MPLSNNDKLSIQEFIIKYSIIASLFTFIVGGRIGSFLDELINLIIEPFFSIDLNENGEPDLKELIKYNLQVGRVKLPLGKILLELIKLLMKILILYYIIKFILNYTNLIDMNKK